MITRIRTMTLISTLTLMVMLVLPGAALAENQSPSVTSSQSSVKAGKQFRFSGANFKGKNQVSVWFTGPDGVAVKGDSYPQTDNDGHFSNGKFTVPARALPGTWRLTARDENGEASTTFTVTADSQNPMSLLTVDPSQGPNTQEYTFVSDNFFDPDENVSYYLVRESDLPNGKRHFGGSAEASSDAGTVRLTLKFSGLASDTWVFFVQSAKTTDDPTKARALSITFRIR